MRKRDIIWYTYIWDIIYQWFISDTQAISDSKNKTHLRTILEYNCKTKYFPIPINKLVKFNF